MNFEIRHVAEAFKKCRIDIPTSLQVTYCTMQALRRLTEFRVSLRVLISGGINSGLSPPRRSR